MHTLICSSFNLLAHGGVSTSEPHLAPALPSSCPEPPLPVALLLPPPTPAGGALPRQAADRAARLPDSCQGHPNSQSNVRTKSASPREPLGPCHCPPDFQSSRLQQHSGAPLAFDLTPLWLEWPVTELCAAPRPPWGLATLSTSVL